MAIFSRSLHEPSTPSPGEARAKVVDRIVLHQDAVGFRTLCERSIPPDTRYLVLDLDRTFHFGHNLGELLGWEVGAHVAYGGDFLERIQATRGQGRFVFDWSRPWAVVAYVLRGARLWAYPGLFYFFLVKLGTRVPRVRRWLYSRFGTDPIEAVQQVPRTALMHHLSDFPVETLRKLARNTWKRYEASQVIQASDLAWLRTRCPGIKIIISSASPQPVLEAAAAELDVDEIFYTAVEEHEGYLSAPYSLHRLYLLLRPPRRISPPSRVHGNAGEQKMRRLLDRFPDFLDPAVQTVGITDTSYGEDHAWADYFKTLIDINSPSPFAPIVAASSPLREIHSAKVLTRAELESSAPARRREGPSRLPGEQARQRTLLAEELSRHLQGILPRVEALLSQHASEAAAARESSLSLHARVAALVADIEREVESFNTSAGSERRRALRRLYRYSRKNRVLNREIARAERQLASVTFALTELLETSRSLVESDEGQAQSEQVQTA